MQAHFELKQPAFIENGRSAPALSLNSAARSAKQPLVCGRAATFAAPLRWRTVCSTREALSHHGVRAMQRTLRRLALLAAVRYVKAGVTSDYAEPRAATSAPTRSAARIPHGAVDANDDLFRGFACDSQAHVALPPTSAILSYATPTVPSELRYKRQDQRLWRTAFGDARSYTAQQTSTPCLADDGGLAFWTARAAANTTSWAVPGSASRRAPPFPLAPILLIHDDLLRVPSSTR